MLGFCPTSRLHEFLFSPEKLTQYSTELCHSSSQLEWLKDPTMELRTPSHFRRVTPQWLTSTALGMLFSLTCIHDPSYESSGFGGSVTTWIKAAKDWHTQRLAAELASGDVISMRQISPEMRLRNQGYHRGIARLREKLHLPRNPPGVAHLPEHEYLKRDTSNTCSPSSSHVSEAEANKYFRRIVMASCVRCPESSYLFYPIGMEGLLEHMRLSHRAKFWAGNFHLLA